MDEQTQSTTETTPETTPVETVEAHEVAQPAPKAPASTGWPLVKAGTQVRVHQRIKDVNSKGEEKERTQMFEGLVIKRHGGNMAGATITVRKNSFGVWVEKIFPVHLPDITNIEVVKTFKTRRANITFVRTNPGKRLHEKKK